MGIGDTRVISFCNAKIRFINGFLSKVLSDTCVSVTSAVIVMHLIIIAIVATTLVVTGS